MSIAITAPQKFDFQDIACVALMLRFIQFSGARFYVEPKDGEDGELHFDLNGSQVVAEIQVKGASGAVTLAKVVSCLAHTPGHTEKDTLIERLLANPNRLAVLVMSARCDDACAPYSVKMDWAGIAHRNGHVDAVQTKNMLDAFAVAEIPGDAESKLKARRQAHNASLATAVDRKKVRAALSRLIIFERLDEAGLESFCAEQLRREHRVPGDRLDDVIERLRAAVKLAKTQRCDAFPLIRVELERATPPPIRPLDYIDRGAETDLTRELSTHGVLLLAGSPRVGKSWAARKIAAEFERHAYEVREFSDIEQVERFLLETTEVSRLALLDDPLGGVHPVAAPARSLSRLGALIAVLRPHRKLIVAQESGRLLTTAQVAKISALLTAGRYWHDLSDSPGSFLVKLWHFLTNRFAVPSPLRERIRDGLDDGSLQLEPGCLQHLAVNHARLGGVTDMDRVVRLAREDAADLGRALAQDPSEYLLSILALSTTAREPIGFTSLAYITGAGGEGLPGKTTNTGVMVTFGGPSLTPQPAPSYDATPKLSGDQFAALDTLEQRRILSIDAGEVIGFAHPFYKAAAECLLNAPTHQRALRMTTAVRRGIFCLSPQTSRATARNIDWVFDKLIARGDAQAALIDIAADGLRSCFPATRDLCFQFLLRHLSVMSSEQRHDLPAWISSVTSIDLYDLQWTNGEAHLSFGGLSDGMDYMDRFLRTIVKDEVATELALLDDVAGGFISAERAVKALQFLAVAPSSLTRNAIGRLLSFDEAVLRAEAIRLWLQEVRDNDDAVLARIFSDDHPSCALAALKGAVTGWYGYSQTRRQIVLQGLLALASNIACAVAMLDRLVLFNRVEETGESPPWAIFEAVLPVVMAAIPLNAAFNDARLFAVARSAVKVLPAASIVAICDGWMDWLARNAEAGRLSSEFSLGIVEILVAGTRDEPKFRAGRVERLLGLPGTGTLIPFVADLVDAWDDINEEERAAVLRRLQSGRTDDRWLQAVVLTRAETPPVIQQVLLGAVPIMNDGVDAVLAGIAPDLLIAAIHVYTGHPQPLWWLGSHHRGEAIWESVVERIARSPTHPLFELAWNHIAGDGARVASVIRDLGAGHADSMLDILLRMKVGRTGDFMPEAWAELLSLAADDDQHSSFIARMAEHVSAILDDVSDLRLWLTEGRDLRAILDRLESDTNLLWITKNLKDTEEIQLAMPQLLVTMVEQRPPQLFGTCDRLLNALKGHEGDTSSLRLVLASQRSAILTAREHTKDILKRADPSLDGWIKP